MLSDSWEVISGADGDAIVLGVDFSATWRPEAGLADLASRVGPGYRFLQTRPAPITPDQRVAGDAYVRGWVQEAERAGWQVAAVAGYCVGAVYAARIAESVGQWQRPAPRLVLFDPLRTGVKSLLFEMYKAMKQLAALLTAEETEQAKSAMAPLVASARGDVVELAAALAGFYRETSAIAFGRLGLNSARSQEMIAHFEAYLSWMSVAATIDPSQAWKSSSVVTSADYPKFTQADPSVVLPGDLPDQKIQVQSSHNDLLRSDSAAHAFLDQMASR
jgi:hypothetical protein